MPHQTQQSLLQNCIQRHQPLIQSETACFVQKPKFSEVATRIFKNILQKADKRQDKCEEQVKSRFQTASDLVAEETKYHRRCEQLFHLGRQPEYEDSCTRKGRPVHTCKQDAFDKLCQYLDVNDECQQSLSELVDIFGRQCAEDGDYSPKWLSRTLLEQYGDTLTVTVIQYMESLYILSIVSVMQGIRFSTSSGGQRVRVQGLMDKKLIIDMAASTILHDIGTRI